MTCFEHIVKSRLHLFWWPNAALLQIDTHHLDTHFVTVENVLHERSDTWRNLIALFGQSRVHFHFANHLTHSSFGSLHNRFCGVFAFEQISARIVQTILHSKLDFNDVFIFCQHGRLTQACGLDDIVAANVNRANLRDKHQLVFLNGVRQTPVKTSAHGGLVFAKLCNDSLLTLLHNEKPCAHPDEDEGAQNDADAQVPEKWRQAIGGGSIGRTFVRRTTVFTT